MCRKLPPPDVRCRLASKKATEGGSERKPNNGLIPVIQWQAADRLIAFASITKKVSNRFVLLFGTFTREVNRALWVQAVFIYVKKKKKNCRIGWRWNLWTKSAKWKPQQSPSNSLLNKHINHVSQGDQGYLLTVNSVNALIRLLPLVSVCLVIRCSSPIHVSWLCAPNGI